MHVERIVLAASLSLLTCPIVLAANESAAEATLTESDPEVEPAQSSRWEPYIRRFEESDEQSPPPKGAILFVGSSSIVFWRSLADDMSPLTVINRGFGGSQMWELNLYRDRIVTNYEPKAIVVYEGDNDIAAEKTVDSVLSEMDDFISHIAAHLPQTEVCFIAVKPSIRRAHLWTQMEEVNAGIRKRAEDSESVCFLDVASPMLSEDGTVREDLFVEDGLHLNQAGYEIWTSVVRPYLIQRYAETAD